MTVADELAERDERLFRVGARPALGTYLRDAWQRREFVYALARFRIEAENRENRLGLLWVLLRPLLNAAVIGLIFGILMGPAHRPPHFISFLVIGVFMFEFFSTSVNSGAKAVTANAALVQSLAFPRIALPVAVVTQRFMQLLPALGIMVVIVIAEGTRPAWSWLALAPLLAIFYAFNLGLALVVARATVHLRDLANLIPYLTRLVFYSTGVFFSFDLRFAAYPRVLRVMDFQPVHVFLTQARALILDGPLYDVRWSYWVTATLWSLGMLVVGIVYFWSAEEVYGRVD